MLIPHHSTYYNFLISLHTEKSKHHVMSFFSLEAKERIQVKAGCGWYESAENLGAGNLEAVWALFLGFSPKTPVGIHCTDCHKFWENAPVYRFGEGEQQLLGEGHRGLMSSFFSASPEEGSLKLQPSPKNQCTAGEVQRQQCIESTRSSNKPQTPVQVLMRLTQTLS